LCEIKNHTLDFVLGNYICHNGMVCGVNQTPDQLLHT